jgi:hypothetical protein
MKSLPTTFAALYRECMSTYWSRLTGRPTVEPTAKAAQVAAVQEWEDEGGSIKPAKKAAPEPAAKIPS